jgi:hypothetical protein
MRVVRNLSLAAAVFTLLAAGTAWAAPSVPTRGMAVRPASIDRSAFIGVNNLQMVVSNVGSFAYDPTNHFGKTDGLYFPRGTDRTVIYAGGIWIGARVNGEPRVVVSEYTQEFRPGGMQDSTYMTDVGRFHVYKVSRGDNAESNPDYAEWPYQDGAPGVEVNGETVPQVLGDQALYAVYNDANPGAHSNRAGSSQPLGLEIQQYVFAFGRSGALGNAIYLKFKIINKGPNLLEDTYVSLWCDPDVGDAGDDLVGCDTNLSLGFAYNEGPDPVYGVEAPAVGYDFLQGPIVPSPGDSARQGGRMIYDYRNLPMTSFNKYTNTEDPTNSQETYNFMRGLKGSGDPVVDLDGDTTLFTFAGDPVTGEGWLDNNADDRRYMMSAGPFTMATGDTQEVVIAVMVGQGTDHLSSVTALRTVSEKVQAVFDLGFDIPFPPPSPAVSFQPLANDIELIWDHAAEGDVQISDILGQRFEMEGYNVYQGETQAGPWTLIATFDVDNEVGRIYRDEFDPEVGAIQRVVTAAGTNSGLANHLSVTTDRITGEGLINYRPYYFAVTAYSYDVQNMEEYRVGGNLIGHLAEVLETQIQGFEVRPNSNPLELVDTAVHADGQSRGMVVVRYFEPDDITGDDYEVTFNEDLTWNLQNVTTGEYLLTDQSDQSGDFDYDVVDGLMVQTSGPEPGIEDVHWMGDGESWVTSVNIGLPWFGGGFLPGAWFFGSTIQDMEDLIPVELRFSLTETQKAYRYFRGTEPIDYAYQDFRDVPLTAWDVSSDPPRQLNLCFVEQPGLPAADGTWLPTHDPSDREYLFILNSDYSETPNDFYTTRSIYEDGADFDVLYGWWPLVADGHSNDELAAGQVLDIDAGYFNKPEDRFTFSTFVGGEDVIAAGLASLDGVHPLPNPYFHATDLETGSSEHEIDFVGLPATELTIEIYNLAGELIRELHKTDPTDRLTWDVRTETGLPVASGVYIYRVVAPGVGERVGKLAVFTEVERVRRF